MGSLECSCCGATASSSFRIEARGNLRALLCSNCGHFVKWLSRQECSCLIKAGVRATGVEENGEVAQKKCRDCGGTSFYTQSQGVHVGEYCANCGCWVCGVKKEKK